MKHPFQKPYIDEHGVHRFTANSIVLRIIEKHVDFNKVVSDCYCHSKEDWTQFYQLIGYSLSGCPRLSDSDFEAATKMLEDGLSEVEARANAAENELKKVQDKVASAISELFEVCPDELTR